MISQTRTGPGGTGNGSRPPEPTGGGAPGGAATPIIEFVPPALIIAASPMRQAPPLSQLPRYPVVGGIGLLAAAVSLAYWSKTVEENEKAGGLKGALVAEWLRYFRARAPEITGERQE